MWVLIYVDFNICGNPKKSWLSPFDLEPQTILEALLAAFGTLGSTFGPSKTIPEPLGDQRGIFNTLENPG